MKKFVKWLLKFLTGDGDAQTENATCAEAEESCFQYDELWIYEENPLRLC